MSKILVMVRTSTEKQSIEDQHREMEDFCLSEGYEKDSIVWVEEQGASAAKVDNPYRQMIDEVKAKVVEDPEIKCFAVWHLNRLVRTEEIWVEIKSFFVSRKVQIICKNPYLKLLTPDGKVDPGMELACGLLVLLAKQDQSERKEKFRRAKKANAAKGKYIGGNTRKYGYFIDEQGYFKENPEESKVVKLIFDLYSTGKYSTYTLGDELKERGINLSYYTIGRILQSDTYTGKTKKNKFEIKYPAIISTDLFDKCAKIRQGNKLDMKRGEKIILGAKLVKCPVCGATCTSNSRRYNCSRHAHHGLCPNRFGVRQDVADELMYRFAYGLHLQYLINLNEGKMEEYREELKILDGKIEVGKKKMEDFVQKKQRIIDTYLEGLIDKKDRDLKMLKVDDEAGVHKDYINSLQEKRRAILRLLDGGEIDSVENFMKAAETITLEDKYEIMHKHIESLVAVQESYGKRDPRTSRPNAVHITIKAIGGNTAEYLYFPKYYEGSNLYVLIDGEWVKDTLEGAVYAMPQE